MEGKVTATSLGKVHYGKLKETFEELGIGSVFVPGGKKADMIKAALEKLAVIKELEDKDTPEEKMEEKIEEKEAEIAEEKVAEEKAADDKMKTEKEIAYDQMVQLGLTKEKIEHHIVKLGRKMGTNNKAHKAVYIAKLEILNLILEKKDYSK